MVIDKLNVTITKTADGKRDYVQIMSEDMLSINVVFIADYIKLQDHRDETAKTKEKS